MNKDMCVACDDGILNIRVGAIIMKDGKLLMVGNDRAFIIISFFPVSRGFENIFFVLFSLCFNTNSQLKCLTERIRFFVLTKPSEVRRTGGTLNGTRQSQSEKDGARIKPF